MGGGWLADRMNRRLAYALAGGTTALVSLSMAFGPRTPGALVGLALLWNLCYGVAFASFCAFVLDTVGRGAVATKYNVFASLGNQAIAYMSFLDGRGYKAFGPVGLFLTDAALTSGGIVLLLAMTAVLRRRDARAGAASG
jgi:predicted MFS family arabinose efflux permease